MRGKRPHAWKVGGVFAVLLASTALGCVRTSCIVEGTLIDTPGGLRPIEALEIGDPISSMGDDGTLAVGRIVGKEEYTVGRYRELVFSDDRTLGVTSSHPLATASGWRQADRLTGQERIRTKDSWLPLKSITDRSDRVRVYDLSVTPHANFFANGLLVHNKCFPAPPDAYKLAGVWVGFTCHGLDYWRLLLETGYTGFCARVSSTGSVFLYDVESWSLNDYDLSVVLAPRDHDGERIVLSGSASLLNLNLTVGRKNATWNLKLSMHRESREEKMKRMAREKMEDQEK